MRRSASASSSRGSSSPGQGHDAQQGGKKSAAAPDSSSSVSSSSSNSSDPHPGEFSDNVRDRDREDDQRGRRHGWGAGEEPVAPHLAKAITARWFAADLGNSTAAAAVYNEVSTYTRNWSEGMQMQCKQPPPGGLEFVTCNRGDDADSCLFGHVGGDGRYFTDVRSMNTRRAVFFLARYFGSWYSSYLPVSMSTDRSLRFMCLSLAILGTARRCVHTYIRLACCAYRAPFSPVITHLDDCNFTTTCACAGLDVKRRRSG